MAVVKTQSQTVKAPKAEKAAAATKSDQKGAKSAGTSKSPKAADGGKKKKQALKFIIECKNPVEDGIMKIQAFVRFSFIIKKMFGKGEKNLNFFKL